MTSLASAPPLEKLTIRKIQLAENTAMGLIRFQSFDHRDDSVEKLEQQLKIQLPSPGEIISEGSMHLFWSGPREWIISVPAGTEQDVIDRFKAELNGLLAVFTAISDSQVVLELSGESARELLSRGSTVDFCPTRFGRGRSLNTRFAGVSAMVACPEDDEKFLLIVDRSLANYMIVWSRAASV